jgi:RimJ/RimL family protein N-acetyltransferase
MWSFPEVWEGHYLRLRPLSLDDLPAFIRNFDPEVYRYLSYRLTSNAPEAVRRYVLAQLEEPGRLNWAIVVGEEVAGRISVIDPQPAHAKLELGTLLFRPYWGTQANKEAKYLLLRYAFETLAVERVQFKVNPENLRSQRSLDSIGAQREGILRRNRRLDDGSFRDDLIYSILREEWPGVRARLERKLYGPL